MAAAAVAVPAAAAGADRSDRDRHRPPPLVPDPAGGVLRGPPVALALVGLGRLGLRPAPIVSYPRTGSVGRGREAEPVVPGLIRLGIMPTLGHVPQASNVRCSVNRAPGRTTERGG